MSSGPETKLVAKMRKAIEERWPDSYSVKISGGPYQSAGLPDLIVVVEGWIVGIEVKAQRPGESYEHALGRVTLRQQARINDLRKAGAVAGPALTVAEAVALVEQALRG